MALQVGSLYVSLGADASNLLKGISDALKSVQKFSAQIKAVGAASANITGAMSAMAAGALALAATVDGPSRKALEDMKAATASVAVEVTRILLPAIRELTSIFQEAARWVAGLSPELKAQISHFAVLAVGVGAAAAGISALAAFLGPLAGLLSSVAAAIAGISVGPLLGVVLVVGTILVVIAVLHKAWRENWGGINEITRNAAQYLSDAFGESTGFVKKAWLSLLETVKTVLYQTIEAADMIQKALGVDIFNANNLKSGFDGLFSDLADGSVITNAVSWAKDVGGTAGKALLSEFQLMANELGLDAMFAKLKAALSARGTAASGRADTKASKDTGDVGRLMGPAKSSRMSAGMASMGGAAASYDSRVAEALKVAAGQHIEAIKAAAQNARAMGDAVKDALGSVATGIAAAGQSMLGKLGDFGNMMSSIINGAQSGGLAGAIGGAITELLSRTAAFQKLVDAANGAFDKMVTAMEPIASGLMPVLAQVIGVVGGILGPVLSSLAPIFAVVAMLLSDLMPFLRLIGMVLSFLTPLFEIIGDLLGLLMKALEPLIMVIFLVVSGIGLGAMAIFRGILGIWNGIIGAIADIVQTILTVISLGDAKWAKGVADGIRTAKANTGPVDDAITSIMLAMGDEFSKGGVHSSLPVQDLPKLDTSAHNAANGLGAVAKVAKDVTESLSNVPTGFRIALARYGATGDENGNAYGGSSSGMNFSGDIYITANNIDELQKTLHARNQTNAFRRSGNPYGPKS